MNAGPCTKERGCITPRLRFNYIVLFIPSLTRKLLFIDNIRRIFIELDEEYIGYLNIGPCVELTFLEGKLGKFLILTFLI